MARRPDLASHTVVVGIAVSLISGLHAVLTDVSDTVLFIGGVLVAVSGFIGVWLRGNGNNHKGDNGSDDP